MRKSLYSGLTAGAMGIALAAAPSHAEIKISDALSISGFLDMSAGYVDEDGTTSAYAGYDQFELDFMYKFSENLSAQADVNYWPLGGTGDAVVLEQAYLTYAMGPASLMAGKFLSSTGFEAAEPTGLYQYSWSNTLVYGGYQHGVALAYTISPMISLYGAYVGSVWSGADTDIKKPGYEAQISLTPIEGLTVKAAYAAEVEYAGTYDSAGTEVGYVADRSLINVWASYATGPITVAAEVNMLSKWDEAENNGLGYLVMANYKLTDKMAVTGRYSSIKMDATGAKALPEVAVSPSYAINDSWLVLAEVQRKLEEKTTTIAAESLLMF